MTNRQIARYIKEFQRIRCDWIELLSKNHSHTTAAQQVVNINAKIELLETFWNWSDETVDFPYNP